MSTQNPAEQHHREEAKVAALVKKAVNSQPSHR